jgi:Cytidylate kinase-like family
MSGADDMLDDDVPVTETPRHGFRGDAADASRPLLPLAPSIAISREVGARGTDIARRIGAKSGWTVYNNEVLGYTAQDPSAFDSLLAELPGEAVSWIDGRIRRLHERGLLADDPNFENVSRLILALGARGEAIFVGRGAGFLLPRETTLHVRLTAPLPDRVAYMSQSLRLPPDEAGKQVATREAKRGEFLAKCFHLPESAIVYDMELNSSALGGELCAELIVAALRCKRRGDTMNPPA